MNNDDLITLNSNSQNEPKICRALCEKLDFFFKDPHFIFSTTTGKANFKKR